jgi:hypothetical protein
MISDWVNYMIFKQVTEKTVGRCALTVQCVIHIAQPKG